MSTYATHQTTVDVMCEPGEIVPSRVQGMYQIKGKLREELKQAGLFAKVVDMSGNVPYLRLYGTKKNLRQWLNAHGYEGEGVRIIQREQPNH